MRESPAVVRYRIRILGAVQGVGFRPFVYRLAAEMKLTGWVINASTGVIIEIQGSRLEINQFVERLKIEKPQIAIINDIKINELPPRRETGFSIEKSTDDKIKTALILPDLATCHDCLNDIFDQDNRRYLYPFTNCTNCGPRFSIIKALPYDRPNTTMSVFEMCEQCREEYENPADRRFHAQPNACPECGPVVQIWNQQGWVLAEKREALRQTVEAVNEGRIVAVKGLGGFHLLADAGNADSIDRLRNLKGREMKPFALMFPSLEAVKDICEVSALEEELLLSVAAPITLLKITKDIDLENTIAGSVAPGNPYLGVMLPYTPLHHILMRNLGRPIVATSGNYSDEPICIEENEAIKRLGGIAEMFLMHNRPIARHVDDSIVRIMSGREMIMRRARGYAPLPIPVAVDLKPTLAVGAHLKNSVALALNKNVFISQHIGDLETELAYNAFTEVIGQLQGLYEKPPEYIACDYHPDYLSSEYAQTQTEKPFKVQHHTAHILSCMAEHNIDSPVLGVSWDGTGLGLDRTIWGGEFITVRGADCRRAATFKTFALPGGDKAVREPRRTAIGLLYEIFGEQIFENKKLSPVRGYSGEELQLIREMLINDLNCPRTSSVGRLFDAVSSILNLHQRISFEGQAAMELEFVLDNVNTDKYYEIPVTQDDSGLRILDWTNMYRAIIADFENNIETSEISARFHNSLVEAIVKIAAFLKIKTVVLSGGCFQNKYLTERAVVRLTDEGFDPVWHRQVPPNDGGIALGQIKAAADNIKQE